MDPAPIGTASSQATVDTIRVALAIADVPLLRLGIRTAIEAEPDMEVVAEIDGRSGLVDRLRDMNAAVVVTDAASLDGGRVTMATIEALRRALPELRILALEGRAGGDHYTLVLRAGADGYLTRDAGPADVVAAIRCVRDGETYVSPSLVTRMINTYVLRRGGAQTVEDAYETLTDREREVLLLAATGNTNREIAQIVHLSEQTVHNYRASGMEKLGFHDRVELLKYALRRGVISVADL
ncbi:MAG TPA: response regulator transcription factor [Candidatus Limnocylindrales bacterium]|nr:response regulator transcription factor [Candidatus Limnocylindrales bacterium]